MDNKDSNGLNIDNLLNGVNNQNNNGTVGGVPNNGMPQNSVPPIDENIFNQNLDVGVNAPQNTNLNQGVGNLNNNQANSPIIDTTVAQPIMDAPVSSQPVNDVNSNMNNNPYSMPINNEANNLNSVPSDAINNNNNNNNNINNNGIVNNDVNTSQNAVNNGASMVQDTVNNNVNNNIARGDNNNQSTVNAPLTEAVNNANEVSSANAVNNVNNVSNDPVSPVNNSDNVSNINNTSGGITVESIPLDNIAPATPVDNQSSSDSSNNNSNNNATPNNTSSVTMSDPTVDNFGSVPVPPNSTDSPKEKKPKKNNKLIVILLVLVLIAVVGYGIYYFLSFAKDTTSNNSSIQTKDLKVELGGTLSKNVSDYAVINGLDASKCVLDTSSVDTTKVSAYKYSITCNGTKGEGTIIVDDTTAPSVVLADLAVVPNTTITPSDFIETCDDASDCSYEFVDEDALMNNLKTVGEYKVKIKVSDSYDNEVEEEANLSVTMDAPTSYVNCESSEKEIDDIYATSKANYKFGFSSSNTFYNALKTTVFSFDTDDDYENAKNTYNQSKMLAGESGKVSFNDQSKTIIISSTKALDDINNELGTMLPSDSNSIKSFLGFYDYTCK